MRGQRQQQAQENAQDDAGDDGKINAECSRSIRMSPGNRPSHFGANPLHITNPSSVMITPMTAMNLPKSRIIQKVARIERRHKLEGECPYNSEIITRHWVCLRRRPKTRFAALFASSRASIIPTSQRTRRPLKKNLKRSTKRTRYWATQRNVQNTISSAQIGTDRGDSSRRHSGAHNQPKGDITSGVAMAAEFNSNSAVPDSATSSKRFSVAAEAARLSADLADARQRRSVGRMSRP